LSGLKHAHVLVLAAGKGTRMGGPKALMNVGGRVWWKQQQERLERVGVGGVTWVVSPVVRAAMAAEGGAGGAGEAGGAGVRVVEADPEKPMFASLLVGLELLRSRPPQRVFVLPVDCPAAEPGVWTRLAETDGVAVPQYGEKHGHPVCLAWSFVSGPMDRAVKECRLSGRDPGHQLRLDHLVNKAVTAVAVNDSDVAVNLNSAAAVAIWLGGEHLGA
jgi:CTP:molybdopterin cytidylyltransferase MocA